MKRISLKMLEEKANFINSMGEKVSVVRTQGCGVYIVKEKEVTENMTNKKAYEYLSDIAEQLMNRWLKENGYE